MKQSCSRKFDYNGTTHVFCKSHANCNIEGQYYEEACFKCRRAMLLINQSDDASLIARTIASLRK